LPGGLGFWQVAYSKDNDKILKRNEKKIPGRSCKAEDLEACVLTNVSSEATTLPVVTEEITVEAHASSSKQHGNVSNQRDSARANHRDSARVNHRDSACVKDEESEITAISDKLVTDVLEKVKRDLEMKETSKKAKRPGWF
jgi:hypothetical protein